MHRNIKCSLTKYECVFEIKIKHYIQGLKQDLKKDRGGQMERFFESYCWYAYLLG